jgi:thioredoxin
MKRSFYILAGILAVSMFSCQGQTSGSKAEDKVMETSVAGESENTASNQTPVHLTKVEFLKQVMDYEKNPDTWIFQGEKPCLIDFYADWCAPCRITSPILEDLAKQYAGRINIYKIDIEKEQELAAVFRVQSIPAFLFCPLDGIPTMSSGISNTPAATKAMFIKQIEQLLLKNESGSPTI